MIVGGATGSGFSVILKEPLFFPGEHRGERGYLEQASSGKKV